MTSLRHRVIQYTPATGARVGIGPAPLTLEAAAPFNDIPSLTVALSDPTNVIRAPAELAIELSVDNGSTWTEPSNMRFCVIADSRDRIMTPNHPALKAVGMFWQLKKAVILPESGPFDADGRRYWAGITPGALIRTLIQEAQARSVLSWLDMSSFSSTLDSNGAAWPTTFTTSHEIGIAYDSAVMMLADVGLIDFVMVGRALKVYVADTFLNPAAGSVTLTQGQDFTEATEETTYELVASRNLIKGDGVSTVVVDAAADKPWGEWEVTTSASGSSGLGDLNLLADLGSARSSLRQTQRTFTSYPGVPTAPKPFFDYIVGSKIAAVTDGVYESNLRVRQITLRCEGTTILSTLVLGDRLLEREVRLQRLMRAASGGISGAGAGGTFPSRPPADDTLSPSPPTAIGFSSTAVLINDAVVADLTVSWTAPTTNTDATILDDLDHFELQTKRTVTGAGSWAAGGTTELSVLTVSGLVPGAGYDARVRAVDSHGNVSTWLTGSFTTNMDGTAPNTPSTSTVVPELGILFLYWNGKDNLGNNPPNDAVQLRVYMSTTSGFTIGTGNFIDAITSMIGGRVPVADLVYGTTYFFKTTLVDSSGNESAASVQSSGIPERVTGLDIAALTIATSNMADLAISTAKIADAAILNAKIANLAVDDAKISALSAGKITVGTLVADITVSARIKTANTGQRVEFNSSGLQAFNSSGTQTVLIAAATGLVSITGAFTTSLAGQRITIDSSGPVPTIFMYDNVSSNYSFINNPGGGIGVNGGTWTANDSTTVRGRMFVLPSGGSKIETIRASDEIRWGGYAAIGETDFTAGYHRSTATDQGWVKASLAKAELSVVDGSGLMNQIYVTDAEAGVNTDPNDDQFVIQLGDGAMFTYGRSANMAGNAYGMFLHGENSFGTAVGYTLGWGATIVSQVDTVVSNEAGMCRWVLGGSSSTGWTVNSDVNQSATIDWIGMRR
jgi:hypothetical protein